jgi:3-oxoacyl-(acyl-carrier-protein) synthase
LKRQVHVAGVGVISAIGNTVSETFQALQNQQSGIGVLTLFDSIHQSILPVGEVKLTSKELQEKAKRRHPLPRTALLGIVAAREALVSSGIKNITNWRHGLLSGTTVGGMDKTERFFVDFTKDNKRGRLRNVVEHECGRSTESIAEALGVNGFLSTINTACSSSVNSIIFGARLIENDLADVIIAGGTDALTKFTLNGFNSLLILDKSPSRPFDASRNGLNLGEGAGYLVLVSDKVLKQESLNSLGTIAGFGNTNDAFHQTASSPEGRGSFGAMEKALAMSGLAPSSIGYINLHGTGTVNNDLSEGTAIKRLFAEKIPRFSSTKAYTGHTLGASGGIEAVFSLLALQHQCVFPNLRFQTPIPELNMIPQTTFEFAPINHVMSNSFGFGGNCSSIIISKNR